MRKTWWSSGYQLHVDRFLWLGSLRRSGGSEGLDRAAHWKRAESPSGKVLLRGRGLPTREALPWPPVRMFEPALWKVIHEIPMPWTQPPCWLSSGLHVAFILYLCLAGNVSDGFWWCPDWYFSSSWSCSSEAYVIVSSSWHRF